MIFFFLQYLKYSLIFFILTFSILTINKAKAENLPDLVTDRPDQTESTVPVLPGLVQVETGILYTEEKGNNRTRTLELPGTLFRIGLLKRIEFRLEFDGYIAEDVEEEEADGFGDSGVGFKIYLWGEKGWRPETGLLLGISLPTGEDAFSTERTDPSFRLLFAHGVTDRISVGSNLGMAWETDKDESGGGRDTLSLFQYTFSVGLGLTDKLGSYLEFFGDIPLSAGGNPAHSFNGGFIYLVNNNFQLDVSSGFGLSQNADDWFVGAGLSFAFPYSNKWKKYLN